MKGINMSKYDLKDAIRHIVHDYVYLVMAGKHTQTGVKYPFNHYAERTFLTHCRALDDFFNPDRRNSQDLHANKFTKSRFTASLPTWRKWRKHINKHLMHLTVGRITNKVPWDGKPNKALLTEFETAWSKFIDELKPEFKPLFIAEITRIS